MSMTDQERWDYEQFLSDKWYERDVIDYAETEAWNKAWDKGYDAGEAEGRAKGEVKGRAEGRVEGRAENLLTTIQALKARGIDNDTIAEITGLSEEEIFSIKEGLSLDETKHLVLEIVQKHLQNQ